MPKGKNKNVILIAATRRQSLLQEVRMRDLLFKNLTSPDRKRKIISSAEIMEQAGLRTEVHRHFVCIVKEMSNAGAAQVPAQIHILKKRNTQLHQERFICRIKGSLYAVNNGRLFLFIFIHSLKIDLSLVGEKSHYLGLDKLT